MEGVNFMTGNTYKTIGGVLYIYKGKTESGRDIFVRLKDGFTVEAFDAHYTTDGLVAWGSSSGYPQRDDQ